MPSAADFAKAALDAHRRNDLAQAEALYVQALTLDPNHPLALHHLGLIEKARNNLDAAERCIRKSLSLKPEQPSAWNNLGNVLSDRRAIDDAIDAYERAVALKSDYAIAWQNLARVRQRGGAVQRSIEASEAQLRLQPDHPTARWNIELCRRELAAENGGQPPAADRPADGRWLSVCVTCYGDFPQYSLRCIDSFCATPDVSSRVDLHVGCNVVAPRVRDAIRSHADAGRITTLIESNRNLNKSPIVRQCLGLTRTPYLLVCDDDSHVLPGWLDAMNTFIERHHPFDVAGSIYEIDRTADYVKLVSAKPWWRGAEIGNPAYRTKVHLAAGGMYLARAAFLRQHNYPDRSMIIWREDAMLSDLTNQVGGRLLRFTKAVMDHAYINDGDRRGEDIMTVPVAKPEDFVSET